MSKQLTNFLILYLLLLFSFLSCKKEKEEPQNNPPSANAGQDISVIIGQKVLLDASKSVDAENDILDYKWNLKSKPSGSQVELLNSNNISAELTPDISGEYIIYLSVNDGKNNPTTDEVKVVASPKPNQAPVSNAGEAQETTVNQKVILNGSASSDPDNDTLSYLWKFKTKPIGSMATITDANKPIASFIADVAGEYIAELLVSDGQIGEIVSQVTISAKEAKGCKLLLSDNGSYKENIEYNSAGYIVKTTATTSINSTYTSTNTYEYDSNNQLIKITEITKQSDNNQTYTVKFYHKFSYTNGVLTKAELIDANEVLINAVAFTYDGNKMIEANEIYRGVGPRLISSEKIKYQYYSNGNLEREEFYDKDNKLDYYSIYQEYDDKINVSTLFPVRTRPISPNNTIKATAYFAENNDTSTWSYQYNNAGLPVEKIVTFRDGSTRKTVYVYDNCE